MRNPPGALTEPTPARVTWMYIVQIAPDGPVKIGHAIDVQERLDGLQSASPYDLVLLAAVPENPVLNENRAHGRWKSLLIRGEWFRPDPELLAWAQEVRAEWEARPAYWRRRKAGQE